MISDTSTTPRDRRTAAVITALITLLVILLLCFCGMHFPPDGWEFRHAPEDESELLFAGEYVMVGDVPAPSAPKQEAAAPEPVQEETSVDEPAPEAESGPSAEEVERQRISESISRRVAFGKPSNAAGKTGSPDGNSTTGAASGRPGFNLKGRELLNSATPSRRNVTGSVVVEIYVNRSGKVTSAKAIGGEPPASGDYDVRHACEQASRQLQFSSSNEAPVSQRGSVTWLLD